MIIDRRKLFEKFGFMRVGGCISSVNGIVFENWDDTYEIEAWIYVDFKRKRVMVDCGEGSEPSFLKGELTQKEEKLFNKREDDLTKEISVAAGIEK